MKLTSHMSAVQDSLVPMLPGYEANVGSMVMHMVLRRYDKPVCFMC